MYGLSQYGGAEGFGPATMPRVHYLTMTETAVISDSIFKTSIKLFTESISISEVFSKILGKVFAESVSLAQTLTIYLNGYPAGIWAKIAKAVTSWGTTARAATSWTKISKP